MRQTRVKPESGWHVFWRTVLILLVGAGILLSCRTAGVQFRKFGYAMKNTLGKVFQKSQAGEGEITPFQAMSTALYRPWAR